MGDLPLPGSKFPKSVREYPFSQFTSLLFSRLDMLSEKNKPYSQNSSKQWAIENLILAQDHFLRGRTNRGTMQVDLPRDCIKTHFGLGLARTTGRRRRCTMYRNVLYFFEKTNGVTYKSSINHNTKMKIYLHENRSSMATIFVYNIMSESWYLNHWNCLEQIQAISLVEESCETRVQYR